MTSGPMRAGALPPDRQPDPQVIAWMRNYRAANPHTGEARASRAWLDAHGYKQLSDSPHRLRELVDAYAAAAKPLTRADIPAGQGPASLFLRPNIHGGLSVWFKTDTGLCVSVHEQRTYGPDLPNLSAGEAAIWDHLAATLPTVDTTEEGA